MVNRKRILIIGVPGVGKTTVSALVADALGVPHHTELFEDNPYMHDGTPLQITNYQISTMVKQYNENSYGVFEVSPDFSSRIFLDDNDYNLIDIPKLEYDLRILLTASEETIIDRIVHRDRPGLVETELIEQKIRYQRLLKYVDGYDGITIDTSLLTPSQIVDIIKGMND